MTNALAVPPDDSANVSGSRGLRLLAVPSEDFASSTSVLEILRQWIVEAGAECESAVDLPRAVRRLADAPWSAIIAVLGARAAEEMQWWADALRGAQGNPRLVVFVSNPSMGLVLDAERLGVLDVLSLPVRADDVRRVIERLRSTESEQSVPLPPVPTLTDDRNPLVGRDPSMLEVYKLTARVAASTATVLIQGASGTGKEIVARTIHQSGPRANGPFVAVNCAAIPENLLESELFGHEKGAFTGAVSRRAGRFELAHGGTLFLDEIVDMSLTLQAKILRAVQEREVQRVGGDDPIAVDVRLISATNRDLRDAIRDGTFREDLYYRLAIVVIQLPRLAERGDDLQILIAHFAELFGARYGKRITSVSDRALDALRAHEWVGNVRELRNVVERAVIVADGPCIRLEHLPDELRSDRLTVPAQSTGSGATLAETEARHIARVLASTGGAISAAASILGIHRNTLARKVREYGL